MSYDLYFFRRKKTTSIDKLNEFLQSEDFLTWIEESGESEEEDAPMLPQRVVDTDTAPEVIDGLLKKPLARAWMEEFSDQVAVLAWLNGEAEDYPEEVDIVTGVGEFGPQGGMPMYTFGFPDESSPLYARLAQVL